MAKKLTKEQKQKLLWKWFIQAYLPWYKRQQGDIKPMMTGDDPPPPPPKDLP